MVFNDSDYKNFVKTLESTDQLQLILFVGRYEPYKGKAIKGIAKILRKEVIKLDFKEIISKNEDETNQRIDKIINGADPDFILYFATGDKLVNSETGFTNSKVKYATPQERYFLRKLQDFKGIAIIDIFDPENADGIIRRSAISVIKFPLPKSPIRRILWHLKHYSLHGYDIKTKRTEAYDTVNI